MVATLTKPTCSPRHLAIADPLRNNAACTARIDRNSVRLTRISANVTMHISVALSGYIGLVVGETQNGHYALSLHHRNREFCVALGEFADLAALEASCKDWAELTGLALLVIDESGAMVRLGGVPSGARRSGTGSATKYRRGGFARRRKIGEATRSQVVLRGAREIIARN